ncbi:MAG TPA: hypothetical protein VIY08_14655 [Candidatus Nitrosocosmicus sp.]
MELKLTRGLTRVDIRLLTDYYISLNAGHAYAAKDNNNIVAINLPPKYSVPSHMLWIVTM